MTKNIYNDYIKITLSLYESTIFRSIQERKDEIVFKMNEK